MAALTRGYAPAEARQKAPEVVEIRPQKGPQEAFLSSPADIVIYGGAAGGGKSFGLLLEALRYVTHRPDFAAVYFRRNTTQIKNPGGLWDESMKIYPSTGGRPITHTLEWKWKNGGKIKMAHLEYESTVHDWQGAQIALICCEENTLVRLADGSLKAIKDLEVGDLLQTLNGPQKLKWKGSRRLENCVDAVVRNSDGKIVSGQIHSTTHKILTPSEGWISYDDMLCESRQLSTSSPMESCSGRKSSERLHMKLPSPPSRPDSQTGHPEQVPGLSESLQGRPSSQEFGVGKACKVLENDFLKSESGDLASGRPSLRFRTPAVLHEPSLRQLELKCSLQTSRPRDEFSCVPSECKGEDCPEGCSNGCDRCDAQPCQGQGNNPEGAQQLSDVGQQSCLAPLDGRDNIPERTPAKLQFSHPYSGQERTATENVSFGSCDMTPCGKKWVVDLTVEVENHYVTESALVQKNCFDELTHFSKKMFFYMLSRNRSVSGIKPYIRASCNPDADSWVAEFIQWWWDEKTGLPYYERSGIVRYFVRISDEIIWGDSKRALIDKYGKPELPDDHDDQVRPKSVTFIPARLEDNQILMKADPGYKANLLAMSFVERERLLGGNWKIRPAAGLYFQRTEATEISRKPTDPKIKWVRRWDLAATIPSEETPDPDWTVGTLMGRYPDGRFVIADQVRFRRNSHEVRKAVMKCAKSDGKKVKIVIPQDPGQAGKEQVKSYITMLVGYTVSKVRESGKKEVRADPYAAQWQAGNVDVVEGPWNEDMYDEYEMFPEGPHDDQVDTGSGAFIFLVGKNSAKLPAKPILMT